MIEAIPFKLEDVKTYQPWITEADAAVIAEVEGKFPLAKEYPHYILTTDHRIVEEPNVIRWGIFLERAEHRRIAYTEVSQGVDYHHGTDGPPYLGKEWVFVSTVFIGGGQEELFETMVFGSLMSQACCRSDTYEEALKSHEEMLLATRQLVNYMRKHGRRYRKDWIRVKKFWELASVRGEGWIRKHLPVSAWRRITRVPGEPNLPYWVYDLLGEVE